MQSTCFMYKDYLQVRFKSMDQVTLTLSVHGGGCVNK